MNNPQILVDILDSFASCNNEEVKKHLRIAAQKLMDEILGIQKPVRPSAVFFTARPGYGDNWTPFKAYIPSWSEENLGIQEGKLSAAKAYRERTGSTLMNAKHAIESHFCNKGLVFKKY